MNAGAPAAAPLLEARDVAKSFGSTRALDGVSFDVAAGEVHALVGENGAGKSTLVKILSGAHAADRGRMELLGAPYRPAGPLDARRRGVAMIYQELSLVPHLTVEENIMLGREAHRFGIVRKAEHLARVRDALALLGHADIRPSAPVRELSAGAQQIVEAARALAFEARIIIFDEPTSSLTPEDARRLFGAIRTLRDRGAGIVYISHFLEEIAAIADRVTVLRDGRSVGSGRVRETSIDRIIELMVGRKVAELYPRIPRTCGEVVLAADALSGLALPRGASFTLRRGQILGIAGLVGAGRTELLRALFGLDPIRDGWVTVRAAVLGKTAPRDMTDRGVGFLSEDRKGEGLAVRLSIEDNLTLSRLRPYTRLGWLSLSRRRAAAREWVDRLAIRARDACQDVADLSGGNQQKVAFARLLHQQADILLLDEPTRGIDVASKAELYRLIGALAARGAAIIFVSSYLPELFGVCDTLAVMARGRLSAAEPVAAWTPERVMACATGGTA